MTPTETVLDFMDRINRHDVERLVELMTGDHLFIDSLGQAARGRDGMIEGWKGYFALCPDYWISHDVILEHEDRVAVFGHAGGTIAAGGSLLKENAWRIPAAWLAVVAGGLIREWRVYADNKPVYDILARQQKNSVR